VGVALGVGAVAIGTPLPLPPSPPPHDVNNAAPASKPEKRSARIMPSPERNYL